VAELYSSDPDGFVERRGVLAAQAREAGQAPVAKQIAALRKPTRSAWVVNRLVQAAPEVPGELASLGDELLAAQRSLDGAAIRELSQRRRQLIEALVRQAFTVVGLHSPPAGLRDEVATTLEAALADPQVARQLAAGTLARAARSEGFGLAGPPVLSLVQGGGSGPATTETGGSGPATTETSGRPGAAKKRAGAGSRARAGSRAGAAGKATVQAQAGGREQARAEARARAAEAQARAAEARAQTEAEARQERERRRLEALAEAEQAVTKTARAAQEATAQEQEQESLVERLEVQLADARQRLAEVRFAARRARNRQRQAGQALDRQRK
jgi:hypothetical protein